MDGARILIAGCGDLGLRTAQRLLARPDVASVHGLRRHPPASAQAAKWAWIAGDLGNAASLAAIPDGITHVMYAPTPGERSEQAYERVFVTGQRNLHRSLTGTARTTSIVRWLFVSSSAVYGEHAGEWIDERTPTAPQGFNGRVLCEAENWLHRYEPAGCVLRLAGLYGPGRTQLLDRLRAGRARAPVDPPHMANRIHIDDAANACETLLMHPSPEALYLGADDQPQALHVLYARLAELVGAPSPQPGPAPAGVGSKRMNNARLRATGWAPRYPDALSGYRQLLATPPA